MARSAILSIRGLYEWDSTIFDGLTLPTPYTKEKLINFIMLEYGNLEVLFPNPHYMKAAITAFSDNYQPAFQHMKKVVEADYNPTENYHRDETETTEYYPQNLVMKNEGDSELYKTGYNSGTFQATDKTEYESTSSGSGNDKRSHIINAHGNIGVISDAKLIKEEFDIINSMSFYKYVAQLFKDNLLLGIY